MPPTNNTPSATTQASMPALIVRMNARRSRREDGNSHAPAEHAAATTAKNPDTPATVPSRCEHVASPPSQNACNPHPANTNSAQSIASRKLAIVGMTGEKPSWTRTTSSVYPTRAR